MAGFRDRPGANLGELPGDYQYKVNAEEQLELWKGATRVAMQSQDGSWFQHAVSSGVGSFHLGGVHSMGSGGENVVWLNHLADLAWFPAWQAVSMQGEADLPLTTRVHDVARSVEPNGVLDPSGTPVAYSVPFTAPQNMAVFSSDVVPAEDYSGSVLYKVHRIVPGQPNAEIASFIRDVVFTQDTMESISFGYPLWALAGQEFEVSLTKRNGEALSFRPGTTTGAEAWRRVHFKSFTDHEVYGKHNLPNPNVVGEIKYFGLRTGDFDGWAICDGAGLTQRQIDLIADAGLGAAWAAAYGASTKPNAVGRVLGAVGAGHAIGTFAGSETATLTVANLPVHTPAGTLSNQSANHTHVIDPPNTTTGTSNIALTVKVDAGAAAGSYKVPQSPNSKDWVWSNAGSISGSGRLYPYIPSTTGGLTDSLGHGHGVTMDQTPHSHAVNIAPFTSGINSANHTHTFTGTSIGSGTAHNNLQPTAYLGSYFIYIG